MYSWKATGQALRPFNPNYTSFACNGRLALVLEHCGPSRGKLGGYRRRINLWLREQGSQVAQACRRQFEFVAAHRVRRCMQVFQLYTRIWDEAALRVFMRSWRQRLARNAKGFLVSATGITAYNWDRERISDKEVKSYSHEIEGIYKLRDSTVVCAKCHLRIIIDTEQADVKYCKCDGVRSSVSCQEVEGWQPFIEREDMLIWRRKEPGGLFAYKVYGSFADVTAEDFLQAQIDVDYRKQWDSTAQELRIIETDPDSESSVNHSADIIYWEMIWPTLFSNRDYVYQRRWVVDKDKGLIIIISRTTEHPDLPKRRGVYRVKTYWSYMVIRPYTKFHEPGIEFGLTYFDDPGVAVPSTVTTWVALRGLSDFLTRMRQASKDYENYKQNTTDTDHFPLEDIPKEQVSIDVKDKLSNDNGDRKSVRDYENQQDDSTDDNSKLHVIHNVQQENDTVENKDDEPKQEQDVLT